MKLNYKRVCLVGMAFFLISAFWQAYDAIVPLILTNHFGLPQTISGAIMSIDNVLAVFLLPIFGMISDKTVSKYGKRTPFIFFGTILSVIFFIFMTIVDHYQLSYIIASGINDLQQSALSDEEFVSLVREYTLKLTLENPLPLIGFVLTLLALLISMATFRSPAVALMPDVTPKPLRSKANAVINLTGTAGGILVLVLGMVFQTSKNQYMHYTGYVLSVCGIMLLGFLIFLIFVKEKEWASEIKDEESNDSIHNVEKKNKSHSLSKSEKHSLLLILASVALWFIGYNSITSKYSVYATNILGFDFNFTLIIAQAAAIVSYIPVGIVASRIGRKKTILAGIVFLTTAFFLGQFVTPNTPEFIMFPVFILAGIGWATINVNSFPMVVELAKSGDVGKYTGYYYTASMAAQIVAPIFSGFLYDWLGMRFVFFGFGAFFVFCSFCTMLFVRHGDAKILENKSILERMNVED